jgi:hypothetical protein
MEKNKQSFKSLLMKKTQKEIILLPQEIVKRKQEIDIINKEINNIKEKLNIVKKQLNKYSNEIIVEEKNITEILMKKNKIKLKQKMIITSINKESIILLINSLARIEFKNIKEIFLLFFNLENEFKDEIQIIIKNKESFIELMTNSYKNIKILAKEKINKFNELKQKVNNVIENNAYINFDKVTYPFSFVIDFIMNCFKLINIKNKIKEINEIIDKKNIKKNAIFLNKILLEEYIQEKEQKLVNLEIYIKIANDIIGKYKKSKNQDTEKEIFDMLEKLKKISINNKPKMISKIVKNKICYKAKKTSEILNIKEKERENEKKKFKKIIFSQGINTNNKIHYTRNNITKNNKLKQISCVELHKNNKINKKYYSPKITINTFITFSDKIKSVNSSINCDNKTLNFKRKKYINNNGQINFEKSIEKQKVIRIVLPSNMTRDNSIKNKMKMKKNKVNSYNNLLDRVCHKSPTCTCEINLNKSMAIINNKILKTEEGNKYINNFEHKKNKINIYKNK